MRICRRPGFLLSLIALGFALGPQAARSDVLLQGFYWDVPSPGAGNASVPWWWDHLSAQANALRLAGFTAVWIPPVVKGNAGGYSDGYDPFDDYDIGSKNQKGTIPTRYGTREQLEKCCAMLRANGLNIYCDIVDNHRDGDSGDFHFQYIDAYGNPNRGRFGKSFNDFHPNVPQDPDVPLGNNEDFNAFGRDLAPINGPAPDVTTDGSGNVTLNLPPAVNGMGYVCYSLPGVSGGFSVSNLRTTQEYAGAQDLDIKPADSTATVQVCRVYSTAGQAISGALFYDTTGWTGKTRITLELDNPKGKALIKRTYVMKTPQGATVSAKAGATGYYSFKIRAANTPTSNARPAYWLRATYTAPEQ